MYLALIQDVPENDVRNMPLWDRVDIRKEDAGGGGNI
jgi:hypothetical protein